LTLATNPVKAYEYLSAGKPVVSVDLPELHEFSDLIRLADSDDKFIQQVKNTLAEKAENLPAQSAARKKFAAAQTWHSRVLDIEKALTEIKEPLVSIIILTYNNLNLTRACLESLEKYTDYNNIEIIIVDNASTDGTPDFLTENYQHKEKYKIILNAENAGFAAGNNTGLKIAGGDYLVLLNNDTRVTPGWVRTMVNHFRHNPQLGLLGPVTNNIGNEAKIPVQYENPDDMFPEVIKITFTHMGKLLPMKTVAFFCVMIPRIVFEKIGLLDENFGLGFFEDDDYCRRVQQAGYEIFCAEDVFIHHHLSASFNKVKSEVRQKLFEKNRKIYESKWGVWVPHKYR
jgi:GT2 family glycosyltransferase